MSETYYTLAIFAKTNRPKRMTKMIRSWRVTPAEAAALQLVARWGIGWAGDRVNLAGEAVRDISGEDRPLHKALDPEGPPDE